jgi:hypothetical protein
MISFGFGLDVGGARSLQPWPSRLSSMPPRLKELGISNSHFQKDNVLTSRKSYEQFLVLNLPTYLLQKLMLMYLHML